MQDQARRVLIADDDADLRMMLAEFLAAEGFEVLEAGDGEEALRVVQRGRPDALLLDIRMPRLGGLRALQMVRKFHPEIKVIIMTAALDPILLREAVFSGATTVLTKPLELDDVAAALRWQRGVIGDDVPPAGVARGPLAKKKVLVVDDEPEVRATIQEILRGGGYDIRVAANGADALSVVTLDPPDVVLLDVQMPGVNGIDVLASIRALNPDVKVIMITGVTRQQVANQAFEHGVFDYIGKPIDPAYLELSIETALTETDS